MSILKQIKHNVYAGINNYSLYDTIFEKFRMLLQKICNITMTVDDYLFVLDRKSSNSFMYKFKFGSIILHLAGYIEFTFDKDLVDVDHSIPREMSYLIVKVDDDLNFKKARYIKRFRFDIKENKSYCCTIYITYNISKKIKMTTQVQYRFNYHFVTCFNLKNIVNPCMFLKDKQMFDDTLMDFMVQFSSNTGMFYQLFEQYPLVTTHKRSCKTFFNIFIKQYKSNLNSLKDTLLTLKMYSV